MAFLILFCGAVRLHAGQAPDDDPIVQIDEGKTYRVVNGEPVTGREVMDFVVEEVWDKELTVFTEHALKAEEVQGKDIQVTAAEVDTELEHLLMEYAKRNGIDPKDMKLDKLAAKSGTSSLAGMRLESRDDLELLRLLQRDKKLPAGLHLSDKQFRDYSREYIQKKAEQKGVVSDPKELSGGEALRIGGRGYSHDEIRQFMVVRVGQITLRNLKAKLDILTLGHITQRALKEKKLELTEDDLTFHFSFNCREREAQLGLPGRSVYRHDLELLGTTPEQYLHSRLCKCDASITRLAKAPLNYKLLKTEFEAHPQSYKRDENLVAHVFVRVLDPDGRPYTQRWQAPSHDAINEFVGQQRDRQFAAAKSKIEGMEHLARENFEETARKYSDDPVTGAAGGKIGRIGKETILMPPCDQNVRDAAVKLKPGEISGPIRSDFGWHLLKCLEKQDVTFDEAQERVYIRMIAENRKRISEELEKSAKIEDKL